MNNYLREPPDRAQDAFEDLLDAGQLVGHYPQVCAHTKEMEWKTVLTDVIGLYQHPILDAGGVGIAWKVEI